MREAQRLNRLWAEGHHAKVLKALIREDGTLDRQTLTHMLNAHIAAYREAIGVWQKT